MRAHQYVLFSIEGGAVTCVFMGKPDLEFDSLLGRTQIKTDDRIYHVAFDPANVERSEIWEWFERFTHAQANSDS